MPFDINTLLDFVSSLAILALIACSHGLLLRRLRARWQAEAAMGTLLGVIVLLQMSAPLEPVPGFIIDLRAVPVALAGAFLGWRGLLPCLAIAVATRLSIGGVGMPAGVVGLCLVGLISFAWGEAMRRRPRRGPVALVALAALGLLCGLDSVAILLLPPEMARYFLVHILPVVLPLEVAGIVVGGLLMERESAALGEMERLRRAASTDSGSGLLTPEALGRGLDALLADGAPQRGTGLILLRLRHLGWIRRTHGERGLDAVRGALRLRLERALTARDLVALTPAGDVAVLLADREAEAVETMATTLRHEAMAGPVRLEGEAGLRVVVDCGRAWTAACPQLDPLMRAAERRLRLPEAPPSAADAGGRDRLFRRAEALIGA